MVINLVDLKALIKTHIMDPLDHRNLDRDVPEFEGIVTTTENVARYCWFKLSAPLQSINPQFTVRVLLKETEKNAVIYPPY